MADREYLDAIRDKKATLAQLLCVPCLYGNSPDKCALRILRDLRPEDRVVRISRLYESTTRRLLERHLDCMERLGGVPA